MAKTTSTKANKVKHTAAKLKTANSIAINIPQHTAHGKGYAWSIATTELKGSLPKVHLLIVQPFLL